jgi:hypothetical protein
VKSVEKLVTQAGILPDERVPRPRLDVRERLDELDPRCVFSHVKWTAKAPAHVGE